MESIIENITGPWMATHTGLKVNPGTMTKGDINIEDIAWALSNICRFNGQCDHFYSVAQHSVYVSRITEELGGDPRKGLLHDATECYVGDMVRPVKYRDGMEAFRILEERVGKIVAEAFNLPGDIMTTEVKKADNIALFTEKDQIMSNSPDWGWGEDVRRMGIKIELMYPPEAYKFFMERYNKLFK